MNVLVVGSSVIDLFLKIDEKHTEISNGKVTLLLGDKIPSEIKTLGLGGNGANISVALTRLEIPTSFYTYLGNDPLSREIEEGLTREGVELLAKRGNIKNAPLHIILDLDSDRIILSHYEKADHDFDYELKGELDFIFLNSIADNWEKAYQKIINFSNENNIPLAFSPGSRQLDNLNDLVFGIIKKSKIFFSNKEEAIKILNIKNTIENMENIKNVLSGIKKLGPEVISITDGSNGAYAIDRNGNCFFIKALPCESSEKTGAGDAYAGAFFSSILLGNDVPTAMFWGALNANAVMQKVGAQNGLLTKKQLDKELESNNNLIAEPI